MDCPQDSAQINCAMEPLPAPSAETPNPAGCRGDCQRNQEHEAGEADGDETPLQNILPHFVPVEEFVEPNPGAKVQAEVEERKQSEHPAKPYEQRQLQNFPQRSNRERNNEESQRPVAGRVSNELYGVRRKVLMECPPYQNSKRYQAKQKGHNLRILARQNRVQ